MCLQLHLKIIRPLSNPSTMCKTWPISTGWWTENIMEHLLTIFFNQLNLMSSIFGDNKLHFFLDIFMFLVGHVWNTNILCSIEYSPCSAGIGSKLMYFLSHLCHYEGIWKTSQELQLYYSAATGTTVVLPDHFFFLTNLTFLNSGYSSIAPWLLL